LLPFIGVFALFDAAIELAYVAVPKIEDVPIAGCCTVERTIDRYQPSGVTAEGSRSWLTASFFGATGLLVALIARLALWRTIPGVAPLSLLFIVATATTAVGGVFLVDVAAPALLGLPYHRCAYDLVPRVPEAIVAVALYVCGSFSVGWAWTTHVLGSHAETSAVLPDHIHRSLRLALWCYLCSVAMLLLEMALA
jgi:hypothetical protein